MKPGVLMPSMHLNDHDLGRYHGLSHNASLTLQHYCRNEEEAQHGEWTPVLEAIDQTLEVKGRPPLDVVYEWVSTVDHKKIGLMYIAYALVFLVIAGLAGSVDADSACGSEQSFCLPAGLQSAVYDAWHDDGVLRRACRFFLALETILSR